MSGKVQDWYTQLFRLMIGTSDNYFKLSDNNLSIITFNYDRSLEYYFYNIFMDFTKSIELKELKFFTFMESFQIYLGKMKRIVLIMVEISGWIN